MIGYVPTYPLHSEYDSYNGKNKGKDIYVLTFFRVSSIICPHALHTLQ